MFINSIRRLYGGVKTSITEVQEREEVLEVTVEGEWNPGSGRYTYKVLTFRTGVKNRWSVMVLGLGVSSKPVAIWENQLISWIDPAITLIGNGKGMDLVSQVDRELYKDISLAEKEKKNYEILEVLAEGVWNPRTRAKYRLITDRQAWYELLFGACVSSWSILAMYDERKGNYMPAALWQDRSIVWINPRTSTFNAGLALVRKVDKKII